MRGLQQNQPVYDWQPLRNGELCRWELCHCTWQIGAVTEAKVDLRKLTRRCRRGAVLRADQRRFAELCSDLQSVCIRVFAYSTLFERDTHAWLVQRFCRGAGERASPAHGHCLSVNAAQGAGGIWALDQTLW